MQIPYLVYPNRVLLGEIMELENLVVKVKEGDKEAFGKIFELTNQKAYYTALRIVKNEEDAKDIVQDAYIKAYNNISTLKDNKSFQAWLNRIVANLCKNHLEKKKPNLFSQFSDEENDFDFEESLENTDSTLVPQEALDNSETVRLVRECIDNLPEEQRLCIIMFYYNDMSIKEIAQALDIPESTVKTRLYYGKKKLREEFENLEKDGTKLYSLGFIPLLKLGIGGEELSSESMKKMLSKILSNTVTESAKAVAKTSATVAVKSSLAKKVVVGLVGIGIISGGVSVAYTQHNKGVEANAPTSTVSVQASETDVQTTVTEAVAETEPTTNSTTEATTKEETTKAKTTTSTTKKETTTTTTTKKTTTQSNDDFDVEEVEDEIEFDVEEE